MEITTRGATTVVELPFVAAVPAGHEILAVDLTLDGGGWLETTSASAVVDTATGIVYADLGYWTVLKAAGRLPEPPAQNPVEALGPGWRVAQAVRGRVRGAVVSTRDVGEQNHAATLLYLVVEGTEAPYR